MVKSPQKYKDQRDTYESSINGHLETYKNTYVDYMNHVYNPDKQDIGAHCSRTENIQSVPTECSNTKAKGEIDTIITSMRTDINEITNELQNLGTSVTNIQNDFNEEEKEYAKAQHTLKNIKQKNAESIMMKKITEDNQAINIVESIYLVAGISFMGFFIWKQLNK